jgi:hypothetical protein
VTDQQSDEDEGFDFDMRSDTIDGARSSDARNESAAFLRSSGHHTNNVDDPKRSHQLGSAEKTFALWSSP